MIRMKRGIWSSSGAKFKLLLTSVLGVVKQSNNNSTFTSSTPFQFLWTGRTSNVSATTNLNKVAYGNGVWVAVGNLNTIRSSTDAVTWTTRTGGFTTHINTVAFGNGIFLAGNNTGILKTSTDGATWTTQTVTLTAAVSGIYYVGNQWFALANSITTARVSTDATTWVTFTHGFGPYCIGYSPTLSEKYVIAGLSGIIKTSTDTVTWTTRTSNTTNAITDIAWGDGKFIATGTGGTIRVSTDATTWATSTVPIGGANPVVAVRYYDNHWYIASSSGSVRTIYTSTDGFTWLNSPNSPAFGSATMSSIELAQGQIVAVGNSGNIATSPTEKISAIAYDGANYAVSGDRGRVSTSTDLITWTSRTSTFGTTNINDIAYLGKTYVPEFISWATVTPTIGNAPFIEYNGSSQSLMASASNLYTSTDGAAWTTRTDNTIGTIRSAAYGAGSWVIVDSNGLNIRQSTDGVTWTTRAASMAAQDMKKVIFGGGNFLAVGLAGGLSSSTDGITWTTRTNPLVAPVNTGAMTYGNGRYVVAQFGLASPTMYVSTDKITWTTGNNTFNSAADLAASPTAYVAIDSSSANASSSTDGVTWTSRNIFFGANQPQAVAYGDGFFNIVGNGGFIRNSTDGITWTTATANAGTSTISVIAHNGLTGGASLFAAGGVTGLLRTSTNGAVWTTRSSTLTTSITAIAYGNSLWLAGASGGLIRSSTDAITWTTRTSWTTQQIQNFAYQAGMWTASAATPGSYQGTFGQSTDGVTWTTAPNSVSLSVNKAASIKNGMRTLNGEVIINHRPGRLKTSTDSVNWSISKLLFTTTTATGSLSAGYGTSLYTIAGQGGDYATSTDLVTWVTRNIKTEGAYFTHMGNFNGKWLASTFAQELFSSTDAITWTSFTNPTITALGDFADTFLSGSPINIRYGNGRYMIMQGSYPITSTDGSTWTTWAGTTAVPTALDINYIGTHAGRVTWTASTFSYTKTSQAIMTDNRLFYAVGDSGTVRASTDGTTWSTATINTTADTYGSLLFATTLSATKINSVAEADYVIAGIGESGNIVLSDQRTDAANTFSALYDPILTKFYAADGPPFINAGGGFVKHNGSQYLAGSSAAPYIVVASTDGFTWTTASTTMPNWVADAAYGQGKWLVVGDTGRMATSTDAVTWNTVTTTTWSTITSIYKAGFGNSLWMVAGEGGQVRTSTDAVTWTTQTPGFGVQNISELVFQSGKFLIGSSGTPLLKATTDGVTWVTSFTTGFNPDTLSVGNGMFVLPIAGNNVRVSTDAVTWTTVNPNTTTYLTAVAYGNGIWLGAQSAVNPVGTYPLVTSTDLTTWVTRGGANWYGNTNGVGGFSRIIYDGSKWMLFGSNLYSANVNYSVNAAKETATKIVSDSTKFIAVGTDRKPYSISSSGVVTEDIIIERNDISPLARIDLAAYGAGKFAAIGAYAGGIKHSTTGLTWTTTAFVPTAVMNVMKYGNRFVMAGESGQVWHSTDAVTWTSLTITGSLRMQDIAYNGTNLWTAVGYYASPSYATSTDGTSWTTRTHGSSTINRVAYGNGIWMIGGANSQLKTSTDAITWTTRSNPFTTNISSISFANGIFLVNSVNAGRTTTSTDGITWRRTLTPESARTTYINDRWFTEGSGYTNNHMSTDLVTWQTVSSGTIYRPRAYGAGRYLWSNNPTSLTGFTIEEGSLRDSSKINDYFNDGTNKAYAADNGSLFIWNGTKYAWRNIGNSDNLRKITYSKTSWIANGDVASYASTDGVTWTTITAGLTGQQVTDTIVSY